MPRAPLRGFAPPLTVWVDRRRRCCCSVNDLGVELSMRFLVRCLKMYPKLYLWTPRNPRVSWRVANLTPVCTHASHCHSQRTQSVASALRRVGGSSTST